MHFDNLQQNSMALLFSKFFPPCLFRQFESWLWGRVFKSNIGHSQLANMEQNCWIIKLLFCGFQFTVRSLFLCCKFHPKSGSSQGKMGLIYISSDSLHTNSGWWSIYAKIEFYCKVFLVADTSTDFSLHKLDWGKFNTIYSAAKYRKILKCWLEMYFQQEENASFAFQSDT